MKKINLSLIAFLSPFLLWIYSFRGLCGKQILLVADATRNFIYTNFYINNLLRGVYPFWNPYEVWGRPDDFAVRVIGEFNPFLYVIPVIEFLGVSFSKAYYVYLTSYFFFGMIGFYLLARELFGNKRIALFSMVMLMFTTIGTNIFNDILLLLVFVPTVWFFYFITCFLKTFKRYHFLALTYCLMIILITYIPFIFVTVFLFAAVIYCIVFADKIFQKVGSLARFIFNNKLLVIFCMFCIAASALPGLLYQIDASKGDYVASWRDQYSESNKNPMNMSKEYIELGGVIGTSSIRGLVSYLDITPRMGYLFFPYFSIIILLLASIASITRKSIFLLLLSLCLLFFSLGGVTPVHGLMFKYVFFVKSFRNIHFLIWFSLSSFILFVGAQLQQFFQISTDNKIKRIFLNVYVLLIHSVCFYILFTQENVILSTYLTVLISLILFLIIVNSRIDRNGFLISFFMILLIVIQPMEMFHYMINNSKDIKFIYSENPYTYKESVPQFKYFRPVKDFGIDPKHENQGFGDINDSPGFIFHNYQGLKYSYFLNNEENFKALQHYIINKFIAYDHFMFSDYEESKTNDLRRILRDNLNCVLIPKANKDDFTAYQDREIKSFNEAISGSFKIIGSNTDEFSVTDFDLNNITFTTNFKEDKFLVYNDSYHNQWIGKLNGKPLNIYRANIAFKGMWIPKGYNIVTLSFRPVWRYFVVYALMILFAVYFIYLIINFKKNVVIQNEQS